MASKYPIYRGLQNPHIYIGFKGKFIAWGIASLVLGIVCGGLISAIGNMYLGGFSMIAVIAGGLVYTFQSQKAGLHFKRKSNGVFIQFNRLKIRYVTSKKNNI